MGKSQRDKGSRFERELANMLRARFPVRDIYRTQQGDRAYQSDVTVGPRKEGHLEGAFAIDPSRVWFECISSHRPNVWEKLRQAVRDTDEKCDKEGSSMVPIVVAKKTRDPLGPVVALRWDDFCYLLGWPEETK